jgi:hypothetical protein
MSKWVRVDIQHVGLSMAVIGFVRQPQSGQSVRVPRPPHLSSKAVKTSQLAFWARRLFVVLAVAVFAAMSPVTGAWAHPSDFESLTLDFLLGPRGLETIDAALVSVPGPGYLPFPSESARRDVATEVVHALGISPRDVVIDAAGAERYHEVGFTVRFVQPFANAGPGVIRVDTQPFQEIAKTARVQHLNLKVCDHRQSEITAQPAETTSMALALQTRSTQPGRISDRRSNDRPGCEIWILGVGGRSMAVSARLGSGYLAVTGIDERLVATATSLIELGLGLIVAMRKRRIRIKD